MNLLKCILTANDCYKAGKRITPKGVMVHSTGANNPWLMRYVQPLKTASDYATLTQKLGVNRNGNSWNRGGTSACVHAFIGKLADGSVATVQTLLWNWRGWHSFRGKKGSANDTHISFEICEDGLTDKTYFNAVYKEAVELTAMLCKEYDLDPMADGVVICHSEGYKRGVASNHGDVMHWFPKHGKSMDTFRKDVQKQMGKGAVTTPPKAENPVQVGYKVKVTASVLNIRKDAGASYPLMGRITNKGVYTIVEEKNGWGKLKSGAGWIHLGYVKKL